MGALPPENVALAGFSKSLLDADPRLQAAFPLVRAAWIKQNPTLDLHVDYTYRSPALQMTLFEKGRTLDPVSGQWILSDRTQRVTNIDGTKIIGAHNYYPAKAVDVYIVKVGPPLVFMWGDNLAEQALYVRLANIWRTNGIENCGALWNAFKDYPHVEVA